MPFLLLQKPGRAAHALRASISSCVRSSLSLQRCAPPVSGSCGFPAPLQRVGGKRMVTPYASTAEQLRNRDLVLTGA